MSLGLPGHLAPLTVSAGLSRAVHAVAALCLVAAFAVTAMQQVAEPTRPIWPALVALLPVGGLLYLLERRRTLLLMTAYLAIGAAFIYLFAIIVLAQVPVLSGSSAWVFTVLKVALVMAGAVGTRLTGAVIPPVFGYGLGEAVTAAAATATGKPVVADGTAAIAAVLVIVVAAWTILRVPSTRRAQPAIHRAARDERLAVVRAAAESKAAALVHDTVLSDLAAIGVAPPGPLPPALADRLQSDLAVIVGQDWSELPDVLPPSAGWDSSSLAEAVEELLGEGLAVTVSGDPGAVSTLSNEVEREVAAAVRQLLLNVVKHSGVMAAELVIYSGESLSVMVIDDGRGFDESAVERDRFGLSQSVRRRIEGVGGSVQIWSSPGHGTSVLVQVPLDRSSALRSGPSRGGEQVQ